MIEPLAGIERLDQMKVLTGPRVLAAVAGVIPLIMSLAPVAPVYAATATADISISLTRSPATAVVGQEVTYVARMTNHGPDDATFVDTIFSYPAQLEPISLTCDLGISPDGPGCEYSSLKAGQTVVSTLVGMPRTATPRKFTVKAKVSFEVNCSFDPNCTFDPHLRNNSASVATRVAAGG
jgi:uncharacterized repeat protein (TIGR01451 family)